MKSAVNPLMFITARLLVGAVAGAIAAGGLTGALLQDRLESPALTLIFAGLLVFAGMTGILGR